MLARSSEKAAAVDAFARDVVPLLHDGRARPVIDRVFTVEDARAAFARMEASGRSGKVLLEFP